MYYLLCLSVLNFIFPFLFVWFFLFIYFSGYITNKKEKTLILVNITISIAYFAFLYYRTDESGDVYRYGISLITYIKDHNLSTGNIYNNIYEYNYPLWYLLYYICGELNLSIQYLNAISALVIYTSIFYVITKLEGIYPIKNIDRSLVFKCLLMLSIVGVFSGYRTLLAFSLVFVGVFQLTILSNRKGYLFFLLGIGIHPVAWLPVISYLFSRKIKFNPKYLIIFLVIGLVAKDFLFLFNYLEHIPFIGPKINTYIFGEWAQYRFQDNGEYLKFYILIMFILFNFYSIYSGFYKVIGLSDSIFYRYNNFIFTFLAISLLFLSFRTFATRLLIDGSIFYYPFIYQVLVSFRIKKFRINSFIILLLWLSLIDFRTFNYNNDSYIIDNGFPQNIIYSPFISSIK
ncbi:EpsG family protein [Photobacterium kishitanii]|uniref:EpsG family protein n=1 Tax=Photobacterium kishitanii TaxID=318456 RepID=UPI00071AEAB8|nr:EpsG family protein [Photobacterium kishitanii]